KTKYLGCYKNVAGKMYYNARSRIIWEEMWPKSGPNFTKIVQICAEEALKLGRDVFAVHFWGECWSDVVDPKQNQLKDLSKASDNEKCMGHVGTGKSSAVYKIDKSNTCDLLSACSDGHVDGDIWHNPETVEKCQSCKCSVGDIACITMKCDYPFPCEKYTPAQKGHCCRKCACHHKGVDKMNGEEWDDRRTPGTCRQCRCINGQASCSLTSCAANCPNPEYIPGRCCPRCCEL
ncbi:hypothetical protein QZH41_015261, partial [Actinostola sp. cb2023]